jgi:hypothetical protein
VFGVIWYSSTDEKKNTTVRTQCNDRTEGPDGPEGPRDVDRGNDRTEGPEGPRDVDRGNDRTERSIYQSTLIFLNMLL